MQTRALPLVILVLAAAVLGLAPILVRLTETGPAAAGFWRLALALPVLWLIASRAGPEQGLGSPGKWALLAGLFFALDMSFWHYGLVMTSVANATVLCNLTPVVVTAFAWFVYRERPRPLFLVALALAVGGAIAMASGAPAGQGTNPLLGDILSASVSLWYASYFLAIQAARRSAGAQRVMAWSTAAGAPLMLLAALVLREDLTPETLAGWSAAVGLALVHVAGQGGVAWALGRLPASITAVTILVQPVVAALLGWLVFAERMSWAQAFGGAVVLAGVILAQRSAVRAEMKTGAEAESPAPVDLTSVAGDAPAAADKP